MVPLGVHPKPDERESKGKYDAFSVVRAILDDPPGDSVVSGCKRTVQVRANTTPGFILRSLLPGRMFVPRPGVVVGRQGKFFKAD